MDATTLISTVKQQLADLIAHYKKATEDKKLTLAEVWELSTSAVAGVMRIVEAAGDFDGKSKKEVVLAFAADFYDQVIAPLDIPYVPSLIEGRVDAALKDVFLKLIDGAVESLVNIFNRTGWFDVPAGTNGANGGTAPSTPPINNGGFIPY